MRIAEGGTRKEKGFRGLEVRDLRAEIRSGRRIANAEERICGGRIAEYGKRRDLTTQVRRPSLSDDTRPD